MKKIILLVLVILSMTGCTKENSKFYLNDEYYNAGKLVDIDSKELTNILNRMILLYCLLIILIAILRYHVKTLWEIFLKIIT